MQPNYLMFADEVREFWYPRFEITYNFQDDEVNDIKAWCDEVLPGALTDMIFFSTKCVLTFKTRQQAMMFKLSYNGQFRCVGIRSTVRIPKRIVHSTNHGNYRLEFKTTATYVNMKFYLL